MLFSKKRQEKKKIEAIDYETALRKNTGSLNTDGDIALDSFRFEIPYYERCLQTIFGKQTQVIPGFNNHHEVKIPYTPENLEIMENKILARRGSRRGYF